MSKSIVLMLLVGLFVMLFSMPVFAESQRWSYYQPTITNDTVPAANAGDTEAMLNVGLRLMHNGRPDDALLWFTRAANAGNPQGSYFCGLWALDAVDKATTNDDKNNCRRVAIDFFKIAANHRNAAAYAHLGYLYQDYYKDNEKAAIAWINAYTYGIEGTSKLLYDISDTNKTANDFLKNRGLSCQDLTIAVTPAPVVKKAHGIFERPDEDEVFEMELKDGSKVTGKVKNIIENKVYFELGKGAVTIYKQENIAMSSRCKLFKEDFYKDAPESNKEKESIAVQPKAEDAPETAEPKDAEAKFALAVRYYKGDGIAENKKEAVRLIRKAAEQGYAVAQCALGLCYQRGDGVAQNDTLSVKWLLKAAHQGDRKAMMKLMYMYSNGKGVKADNNIALEWAGKACDGQLSDADTAKFNAELTAVP